MRGRAAAVCGLAAVLCCSVSAQIRRVAITIDDLPRGGDSGPLQPEPLREMTEKLLRPLRGIPVTGFVNAGKLERGPMRTILQRWVDAGVVLGNHTYSHPNINQVGLAAFEEDVVNGESVLVEATGGRPKYFRHPFLFTGKDPETKAGLQSFLENRGYAVAPVTLDTADYMFALVYENSKASRPDLSAKTADAYLPYMESIFEFFESRSREFVGREFPQILLIHANQLNADKMPELLAMMRRRGYEFVPLEEALKDPVYESPETYAGTGGFSWIHRWTKSKGMRPKGEPDPPDWIMKEFERRAKQTE